MSCPLTAFSVKIVASAETAIKVALAREALAGWNATNAWLEKRAFLALAAEETAELNPSDAKADLVVAFFCAGQKAAGPRVPTGAQTAERARAGLPTLIYVSEARAVLQEAPPPDHLKAAFPPETVIDSFRDEKEFRAKFAQRLDALVRYHPHFRIASELSPAPDFVEASPPEYSEFAQKLLIDACDDPEAYVARVNDSRGLKIQVNGRQYIKAGDNASALQWDSAFHELLSAGLLRDAGFNNQLFQISSKGFQFLETLGKHPIGYIEELGSV